MFGYIRPAVTELKVKENELFKACYCGLCSSLGRNYGQFARFILNYDFTYLSMLLWKPDMRPDVIRKCCPASPCRKKCMCSGNDAFDTAAGFSVILTWWKLQDSVDDNGFFKSIPARIGKLILHKSYKKAEKRFPGFSCEVRGKLEVLSRLQNERCDSVDKNADQFAQLLAAAGDTENDETRKRVLRELLYHTGRFIYIVDACDDLKDDVKNNAYNAVSERFGLKDGVMTDEAKKSLSATLIHSRNMCGSAFELLPKTPFSEIVRNVIFYGMPAIAESVLDGTWNNNKMSPRKEIRIDKYE